MSFLDDAISSVGQDLAKTAAQQIDQATGTNAGAALYTLYAGQAKGGENIAALGPAVQKAFGDQQNILTQLQAGLYQQGLGIAAIGNQLAGISSALAQITGIIQNIKQMLSKIGQEQLYQEWQAVDNQMTTYIAAIDAAYDTYGSYISNYKTTPSVEVNFLIENILNVNNGPKVGLGAIHDFMMGGGQSRGSLQLWSAMVTPLVQTGMLDYRLAVKQYFEYYQKLAYAELRATNLVMEAYHYHNDQTNAKKVWAQYNQQLLDQEDIFITWLTPLVYAGVEGGVFVPSGLSSQAVNATAYDAAMQLNPGMQYVRGDANVGDSFYTPSRIFADAEQLLANLYLTDHKQRRIVVHMLYPDGGGINTLLDGLFLTLSPLKSAASINPVSNTRLGSPYPFPGPDDHSPMFPDQNIYTAGGFYLKRYVFADGSQGGLTDGQYLMTNLNGRNGLVPMQTYLTEDWHLPAAPFQQDNVTEYTLQVNSAKQFDFMNFGAYTVPRLYPG
jgi:hypothetical protein